MKSERYLEYFGLDNRPRISVFSSNLNDRFRPTWSWLVVSFLFLKFHALACNGHVSQYSSFHNISLSSSCNCLQ